MLHYHMTRVIVVTHLNRVSDNQLIDKDHSNENDGGVALFQCHPLIYQVFVILLKHTL